jgi:hypothetical protein
MYERRHIRRPYARPVEVAAGRCAYDEWADHIDISASRGACQAPDIEQVSAVASQQNFGRAEFGLRRRQRESTLTQVIEEWRQRSG